MLEKGEPSVTTLSNMFDKPTTYVNNVNIVRTTG